MRLRNKKLKKKERIEDIKIDFYMFIRNMVIYNFSVENIKIPYITLVQSK